MKYKILKDFTGSPDRIKSVKYQKGQEYTIGPLFSEDLAFHAMARGLIREIKKPIKKADK